MTLSSRRIKNSSHRHATINRESCILMEATLVGISAPHPTLYTDLRHALYLFWLHARARGHRCRQSLRSTRAAQIQRARGPPERHTPKGGRSPGGRHPPKWAAPTPPTEGGGKEERPPQVRSTRGRAPADPGPRSTCHCTMPGQAVLIHGSLS